MHDMYRVWRRVMWVAYINLNRVGVADVDTIPMRSKQANE